LRDIKARFIGQGTLIQGDVIIGEDTWVGYYCFLDGLNAQLTIGKHCSIANFVRMYTHDTSYRTVYPKRHVKEVEATSVGDYTQVGEGTIVLHGVHIGSHTIIGAGSVVTHDIPDWSVAVGVPCKVIKLLEKVKE